MADARKNTHDVFGMSNEILPDSYVDRGQLDETLAKLLRRRVHIAISGPSKSGKSWLRQQVIPNALVVQCRLGYTTVDIYRDALAQLGIRLIVEKSDKHSFTGKVEASAEAGTALLAKLEGKVAGEFKKEATEKSQAIGKDVSDLRFIAELLIASARRLVVEDVHYVSSDERERLAYDLKALWDYGCFVVVVGVWGAANMFIDLNQDLSGRVEELTIEWSPDDLRRIIEKGGTALHLTFARPIQNKIVMDAFGSAGLLQRLVLRMLDELGIEEAAEKNTEVNSDSAYEAAAMAVADQLNGVYQRFSERVASGIRTRAEATGIYAHAMAVIIAEMPDAAHMSGISVDEIYERAHRRQPRIQKSNLKSILRKIDGLQCDRDGRGLVVTYVEKDEKVLNVDRQLLFYRRYVTVNWPWEDLVREAEDNASQRS